MSDSGHIVYLQDDTLFAMPFDLRRLTVTGPAARTIDGIQSDHQQGQCAVDPVADGHDGLHFRPEHIRRTPDSVDGPDRGACHASRRAG